MRKGPDFDYDERNISRGHFMVVTVKLSVIVLYLFVFFCHF